jgi:hypothetical protein
MAPTARSYGDAFLIVFFQKDSIFAADGAAILMRNKDKTRVRMRRIGCETITSAGPKDGLCTNEYAHDVNEKSPMAIIRARKV